MPDIFGYIKKRTEQKKNDTKMELYGLDCVDLVVSYTIQFFSSPKSANSLQESPPPLPPPAAFQQIWTDRALC